MVRRRTVFSTPFVVVLGCSQPAERPVVPPTPRAGDGQLAAAPADAGDESARIRAAFEDGGPARCAEPSLDKSYVGCNPPAPDARVAAVREGEVVGVQRDAGGIYFTAKMGTGTKIERTWTGVFLDGARPIAGSEFKIHEVNGSMMVGFLANRSDVPSMRVRVSQTERP